MQLEEELKVERGMNASFKEMSKSAKASQRKKHEATVEKLKKKVGMYEDELKESDTVIEHLHSRVEVIEAKLEKEGYDLEGNAESRSFNNASIIP